MSLHWGVLGWGVTAGRSYEGRPTMNETALKLLHTVIIDVQLVLTRHRDRQLRQAKNRNICPFLSP